MVTDGAAPCSANLSAQGCSGTFAGDGSHTLRFVASPKVRRYAVARCFLGRANRWVPVASRLVCTTLPVITHNAAVPLLCGDELCTGFISTRSFNTPRDPFDITRTRPRDQ